MYNNRVNIIYVKILMMNRDEIMSSGGNINSKLAVTFRALKHKNYRYFWIGQCISLIGTWMQNIGQSWLVYSLTDSPFLLGLISTLQFLPMLLFSLFAGVIVDRFPKKRILIITQSCLMLLAFALSALVWTGVAQYWHILLLAALLGFVNTIDMPTRQSFMVELVGKDDLMNAIALNSSIFNVARIIGPGLAGIMMGLMGASFCFLLNGLSFIAVIIGLLLIKTTPFIRKVGRETNVFRNIKEGLVYTKRNPAIFITLFVLMMINIFIMNFNVTVPVFAVDVLHLEETGYGFLMTCMGIGSFIGAMIIASKTRALPGKRQMYSNAVIAALVLVPLGFIGNYYVSMLLLAVIGFFTIRFTSMANSAVQLSTEDEYRGRVMSLYTMVFAGTTPFGSLFAGSVTSWVGASTGYIISGAAAALVILIIIISRRYMENKVKSRQPDNACTSGTN